MSEPYLTTRDVLIRIEADVAELKRDVHKIQVSQAGMAGGDVAEHAVAAANRARAAVIAAAGSFIVGLAGLIAALVLR